MAPRNGETTRLRLLEAARDMVRTKGYAATSVDDICAAAGVTKGSFFHHFDSKERLGIAAAEQFNAMATEIFTHAPYAGDPDPLARVFGYVDFRARLLERGIVEFTCLLGTLVQEIHMTHPQIRDACAREMSSHVAMLDRDIAAAKAMYAPDAAWTASSVGYFMQSVLQGAFIFAKAQQNAEVAREAVAHLRRYLAMLFNIEGKQPS